MAPNPSSKLILTVYHKVPSLNRLFSIGAMGRLREKRATQSAILSALLLTESENAIPTIFVANTSSMPSDILACYIMTERRTSPTKSRRRKSRTRNRKKH